MYKYIINRMGSGSNVVMSSSDSSLKKISNHNNKNQKIMLKVYQKKKVVIMKNHKCGLVQMIGDIFLSSKIASLLSSFIKKVLA